METLPLHFLKGHLFVELDGGLWLLDTGAPLSFGSGDNLRIAGECFPLDADVAGLTAGTLTGFVGVGCRGLLGVDVLGRFDHVFDVGAGTLLVGTEGVSHEGRRVALEPFMGIPIVTVRVGAQDHRMFLDTGAQLSYFQHASLPTFPAADEFTDFHPGVGRFRTDTHTVPVTIGGIGFTLRCGTLPAPLAITLELGHAAGIVGNAVLQGRKVGWFPRRRELVL